MNYDEAKLEVLSAVPDAGTVYRWKASENFGAHFKVRVAWVSGGDTIRFRLKNQEPRDSRGVEMPLTEFWQKLRDGVIRP